MTINLDTSLWLAGVLTEAIVIGLLLYRRVWRTLPVFFLFCIWNLLGDGVGRIILSYSTAHYTLAYLVITATDAALEICVLIELAWSVLRPIRKLLPRGAPIAVGLLILAASALIWPFAGFGSAANLPVAVLSIIRVQQTASILRILFFVALAGFSQLLSMGWHDRELQVATGLGFFSLVNISTTALHAQNLTSLSYTGLTRIVAASYLCSMVYWVVSFAQKEAERKEFSPQMQNFLLALAGSARSQRMMLSESKDRDRQ